MIVVKVAFEKRALVDPPNTKSFKNREKTCCTSPVGASFCIQKYMDFKKIPIACPKCGTQVMTWNGITKIPMATRCKKCGSVVVYDPTTEKARIGSEPTRVSASGKRYF